MSVRIEKIVFGGQALARDSETNKVVFLWNALPGELVEYEQTKKKRGIIEGIATKILEESKERITPKEDSYLSTSPWQMMTYEAENKYKLEVSKESYQRDLKTSDENKQWIDNIELVSDDSLIYGYRNKIEFSFFTEEIDSPTELCFFARGKHTKIPVQGSLLAEPIINETANKILDWLNEQGINRIDLKTLILRSDGNGKAIAALFVKKGIEVSGWPELTKDFLGFQVYFSNPKSPASVPTELLYAIGQDYLQYKVEDKTLKFGLLSFFQVHIPVFTKALQDIRPHIDKTSEVLDFYSGVGSIGIPLSDTYKSAVFVESNEEAVEFAQENIESNNVNNAVAVLSTAETALEYITSEKILILDPPRAGLHKKIIERILEKKPKKIVYLSCNISTQARDVSMLLDEYNIVLSKVYNFFPRTPHIEALLILEKK